MIDPTGAEWEVAMVDHVINYQVEDQVGAIVHADTPATQTTACILLEARHIRLDQTMRFMLRFNPLVFEQLASIVDEMREVMTR